jgi:nicotinate-nucleotide adenylyltransferase
LKLAIFGGTFDPIHRAHLTVAREALLTFTLDKVIFIPAAVPPHKAAMTGAPYEDRFQMVRLACEDEPRFQLSRLEEDKRKSYSIFTIERVRALLAPSDELFFIIGADAFAEIRTWFRWQDVIAAVEFIVVTRPGHEYDVPPGVKVRRLETLALPVSSSEIRRKLAAGEPAPELPETVARYILDRGLYGH